MPPSDVPPGSPVAAPQLKTVLGLLRDYLADQFAPERPARLTVEFESGHKFEAPIPPVVLPPEPANECEQDILRLLEMVGHRMTVEQVLSALPKHDFHHGDSSVRQGLARMAAEGLLTKNPRANPRGYGLPGWEG